MQTILALERDIALQLEFMHDFKPQKPINPKNALFCGSGDSLASSMMAECFSDYDAKAVDPLDLTKNRNISKNKHVYFVSISGNTVSNIRAAKMAKKSTAITKNDASKLAKMCKEIIRLNYNDSKTLTSGSISFLASMLTCISLVYRFRIRNAKKLFLSAQAQARKISLKNKVYFLGNQHTYPIAMYAAAKLHEVLGLDARYERMEQFSHMGLFSAKRGDTVIIFERNDQYNKRLTVRLKKLGLHVHNASIESSDKISQVVFYTFVSQFVALNGAKRKRLADCYFITEKKIRNVSSSMIY
ncbi:MAG: sugar isomerase [Candidatus Nitrosotenuis sp.]|nr:MAG: sugar isomerase [Candidatus Nitrosotenuis sp.]